MAIFRSLKMSSQKHWGEIEEEKNGIDDIESLISNGFNDFNINQLNQSNFSVKVEDEIKIPTKIIPIGNCKIAHSIRLMKLIRKLQSNDSTGCLLPQLHRVHNNKSMIEKTHISQANVKLLVRQAIILITVYCGYENTTDSVLNVLVDIFCDYLRRMCNSLRIISDSSELRSANDFIDVINRVFNEMLVPNLESLQQYDNEINSKNQKLENEALDLYKQQVDTKTDQIGNEEMISIPEQVIIIYNIQNN